MQAQQAGITKAMLTCFATNAPALAFYAKLGYTVDASSPAEDDPELHGCARAAAGAACSMTCDSMPLDLRCVAAAPRGGETRGAQSPTRP